jgi:pseudouridine synthase
MQHRLQKILAQAGIASRRKCEEIIAQGRVKVNGAVAKLGSKADPEKDKITVDGKPVEPEKKVYIMLNKPKGYVTTVSEQHGMKTVMEIVKTPQKIFPVGRLDKNTEGLLLLTNDGELANKITHPRYQVEKEYYALLDKPLTEEQKQKLRQGIMIEGRKAKPTRFNTAGNEALLRIHEGRKHIVRKMFAETGRHVVKLVRTRVGNLTLGSLYAGKWRQLTPQELNRLRNLTHDRTRPANRT